MFVALVLAAAGQAAAQPAPLSDGAILYGYRCNGCHEPATPGAPTRADLAKWSPEAIEAALTTGKMKQFATGLSADDIHKISEYLGAK